MRVAARSQRHSIDALRRMGRAYKFAVHTGKVLTIVDAVDHQSYMLRCSGSVPAFHMGLSHEHGHKQRHHTSYKYAYTAFTGIAHFTSSCRFTSSDLASFQRASISSSDMSRSERPFSVAPFST